MADCTRCVLHETKGRNYVKGRGNTDKGGIAIIGDYPAEADAYSGMPFISAQERDHLDHLLTHVGLDRTKVFCTNLVRCAPPRGNDSKIMIPLTTHLDACQYWLDKEISVVQPKVILLMGALAVERFLGKKATSNMIGRAYDSSEIPAVFGYSDSGQTQAVTRHGKKETVRLNRKGAFKVIVCRSLAAVGSGNPQAKQEAEAAFKLAKDILDGKDVQTRVTSYKYGYTADQVEAILEEVLRRCNTEERMVFDIETSGINWWPKMFHPHVAKTLSIAFCFQEGEAYAVSLRDRGRSEKVLALLKQILEHPIRKGGHNGKFDNVFVRGEFSIRVSNFTWDTMLAAFVLNQEGELGLDKLCPAVRPDLGAYWVAMEKHLDDVYGYLKAPDNELLEYNAKDVDATMSLWLEQEQSIPKRGKEEAFKVTMGHLPPVENAEFFGVPADVEYIKGLGKSMLGETRRLEAAALATVGRYPHWWGPDEIAAAGIDTAVLKPFNMGSPQQIAGLLFTELKLKAGKVSEKTNQPSTDADTLKALKNEHEFVDLYLQWKKASKMLGYIGWEAKKKPKRNASLALPGMEESPWEPEGVVEGGSSILANMGADGRLRANFRLEGAATARISITNPPLQTLPKTKDFRNMVRTEGDWVIVDSDFKALELRILALLTQDPTWLQIFKDNIDPHSVTASKMFGIPLEQIDKDGPERKKAKAVNFGIPYGEGAEGLANDLKVPKAEAQKWLDDWNKAFPLAAAWLEKQVVDVKKNGYARYSLNRERPLGGIFSNDRKVSGNCERAAKNTPIQGTGGDCTSISMARIYARLRAEFGPDVDNIARIILEVHDQIVVECRKGVCKQVLRIMEEEMSRQMPMLPANLALEVDGEIKVKWGEALKPDQLEALLAA